MAFKPYSKEQLRKAKKDYFSNLFTEQEFISKFGFNPKNNYSFFLTCYFYEVERKEGKPNEEGVAKPWYILSTTQKPETHLTMDWAFWPTDLEEAEKTILKLVPNDKIVIRVERILLKHSDDSPSLCGRSWDEKFVVKWVGKAT